MKSCKIPFTGAQQEIRKIQMLMITFGSRKMRQKDLRTSGHLKMDDEWLQTPANNHNYVTGQLTGVDGKGRGGVLILKQILCWEMIRETSAVK